MLIYPLPIKSTRVRRTYRGGKLIDEFRGFKGEDSMFPEEWLLSTVTASNPDANGDIVEGLSIIENTGESLVEFLSRIPEGRDIDVLVKLIDAAERLSIQVHPTREDAVRLLNSPYGKTECWHILGGREIDGQPPCIYLGFKEGITREIWSLLFDNQNISGMLEWMHKIEVQVGETYFIPGGVPHAIGKGCFLVEIQEPSDITLRAERTGPSGNLLSDFNCHQGMGFDAMLGCFSYKGYSLDETIRRWRISPRCVKKQNKEYCVISLIDHTITSYFQLEKLEIEGMLSEREVLHHHGLFVVSGQGSISFMDRKEPLVPGTQYFVPARSVAYDIQANEKITMLRYKGPDY
jgi:mannose-6-phosphate isomerase